MGFIILCRPDFSFTLISEDVAYLNILLVSFRLLPVTLDLLIESNRQLHF